MEHLYSATSSSAKQQQTSKNQANATSYQSGSQTARSQWDDPSSANIGVSGQQDRGDGIIGRSAYSTNHTIGIHHTPTSSAAAALRGAKAGLGMMMGYNESAYAMLGELSMHHNDYSSASQIPVNLKAYHESQLLPMKNQSNTIYPRGIEQAQQSSENIGIPQGYFFESPSKYISLKQYKSQNGFYGSTSTATQTSNSMASSSTPVFDQSANSQQPKYTPVIKNVRDWFERLSLQDKSIVLTIVDKQLVNLVYQMFKVYSQDGNVKFLNHQYSPGEANDYERVNCFVNRNFNLLYKRQPSKHVSLYSSHMKKMHEAENALITNIRLLRINKTDENSKKSGSESSGKKKGKKGQSQSTSNISEASKASNNASGSQYINNFDALTLDLQFFKNPTYFFEIMRFANQRQFFLGQDMKLNNDLKRLEQSVFYTNQDRLEESPPTLSNFYGSRRAPPTQTQGNAMPQKYFTMVHQPENNDGQGMTLGQCLLLIFEKAINVQYYDYLQKLDTRHQQFFYQQDSVNSIDNVFLKDQVLTRFWAHSMKPDDRQKIFDQIDIIEKEMRTEEHNPVKVLLCSRVIKESSQEESNNEEEVNVISAISSKKRLKMLFQEEEEEEDEVIEHQSNEDDETSFQGSSVYSQQRVRGYASAKATFAYSDDPESENEDTSDYRYPSNTQIKQKNFGLCEQLEEEDNFDLESQRKLSSGKGAVGKLKALRSSKKELSRQYVPPNRTSTSQFNKNVSLQEDEDEEYEDDFEPHKDSEEDEDEERDSYFIDHEQSYTGGRRSTFSSMQSSTNKLAEITSSITKKRKEQLLSEVENPLVSHNKFFFIKQELLKYRYAGNSSHSSPEIVERMAFEFIKALSTFISLETVMAASIMNPSGSIPGQKTLNFSSREENTQLSSMTSSDQARAIPIKQRLYTYLSKWEEEHRWEDLLKTEETKVKQHAVKEQHNNNPYSENLSTSLKQLQSKVGGKPSTESSNNLGTPIQASKVEPIEIAAVVVKEQSASQKNKKKKKREKEKLKKAQALAKLATEDIKSDSAKKTSQIAQQIKQEQFSIDIVRELMQKGQMDDLYRDSFSLFIPGGGNHSIHLMGEANSLQDEIIQERRRKEERMSLLTGVFQADKYPEEIQNRGTDSHHLLLDPTIMPDRSSLSPREQQYRGPQANEDVEMIDESEVKAPVEVNKDQKKKKRKKNKKKAKKPLVPLQIDEVKDQLPIDLNDITTILSDIQSLDNIKHISSNDVEEPEITALERARINNFLMEHPSSLVTPLLDQIIIEIPQDVKDEIESARKLGQELRYEIEQYEQTQRLTEEMSQSLIQQTIESIQEDEATQVQVEETNKKKNNKKQAGANNAKPSGGHKMTKKQAKQAAKKALAQEKKAAEEAKLQLLKEIEAYKAPLTDENLKLFQAQELISHDESGKEGEGTPERTKKVVGFRVTAQTSPRPPFFGGYHSSSAEDPDNVKIPKRGSSRGSSCAEELINQTTINMLGDLFPQQYKNPSDDTKLRISKITTSSSSSLSNFQSPTICDFNLGSHTKAERGSAAGIVTSKFLEEPYFDKQHLSKKRKIIPPCSQSPEQPTTLRQQNNKGNNKQNGQQLQYQQVVKPQAVKQTKEFVSYEDMFYEKYEIPNQSSSSPVKPIEQEEEVKTSFAIELKTQEQIPPKVETPVNAFKNNNKKKGKPSEQQHQISTIKEMKERGAIARPIDIEIAQANNQQTQSKKQNGNKKQKPEQMTIIPNAGMMIHRSQTPNAEQICEPLQTKVKHTQKNANGATNHPKQNNNASKNQSQAAKRKGGPPSQSNNGPKIVQQNPTQQQIHYQPQQMQQQSIPNNPQFDQFLLEQQQQAALFFAQQQLLGAANNGLNFFVPPSTQTNAGSFFMPPTNNNNPASRFLPAQQQYATNGYFTNQDYPNNYQASQAQTPIIDLQTEQPNEDQQTTKNVESQQHFMINQYQNINVSVHLPGQQQQQQNNNFGQFNAFQQPGFVPYVSGNTAFDQQLQQQIALQNAAAASALLYNQNQAALISSLFGGSQPNAFNDFSMNPAGLNALYGLPQFQNPYSNPMTFAGAGAPFIPNANVGGGLGLPPPFNPFQGGFGQSQPFIPQQQQQIPSAQQQQPVPAQRTTGSHQQQPQQYMHNNNLSHQPQRLHSFQQPAQMLLGGHHSSQQQTQAQQILSLLSDLTLANHSSNKPMMSNATGGGVSHMSQEDYEQQHQNQESEDQFYQKVDQEIYKLQNKIQMKLRIIDLERQTALRKVEMQVKDTYSECPSARVQMYGSMATGLAIDSSDMDLLVSGVFHQLQQIQNNNQSLYVDRVLLVEQMKRLHREICSTSSHLKDCLENVQLIETASVPVIKLIIDLQKIRDNLEQNNNCQVIEEDMRYLKIDITFNDNQTQHEYYEEAHGCFTPQPLHMGIKCCHFIKQKLQEYNVLEQITLVLKKFLALRNLNSPFLGGLNSYGLIILIVAFLNNEWPELYSKEGKISASRTLKCFLYYFGHLFDPSHWMINDLQQIVPHMSNSLYSTILIIQDPLNSHNNIGKSTFNWDSIRQEFIRAHDTIGASLTDFVQTATVEESNPEDGKAKVWQKKLNVLNSIIQVSEQSMDTSNVSSEVVVTKEE